MRQSVESAFGDVAWRGQEHLRVAKIADVDQLLVSLEWRESGVDLGELLPTDALEFGGHEFDVLKDQKEAIGEEEFFGGLDKAIEDGVGLFEAPPGFCEGEIKDL